MAPRPHSFAARLVTTRLGVGMSKSALARAVGVSPTCVWNWEEGNTEPRAENLAELARALKVSRAFLETGASDSRVQDSESPANSAPSASLLDVIADAKGVIAAAAGISPDQIKIQLDY